MKGTKAVIFDWGGVCCSEGEPFASDALQKRLSLNPDQIAEKVRSIYNGYYLGKYTNDFFWREIMRFFNLKENSEINPRSLSEAYLNSYSIYPDVMGAILKLRKKYKVGLLSNLTPEMRDRIKEKHDLKKYFDAEVFSCDEDVAVMKPDSKPYEVISERLGVPMQKCLFIDNSLKNIDAAKRLGMKTTLFSNKEKFLRDIAIFCKTGKY